MWICKDTEYYYSYSNYPEIYYPETIPRITGFEIINKNQISIKLSEGKNNNWKIVPDEGQPYNIEGSSPIIKLLNRIHIYKIVSLTEQPPSNFTLKIDYCPKEVYSEAQNSTPDSYHVVYASIPIGRFIQYPIEAFLPNMNTYSEEELRKTSLILEKDVRINLYRDTQTKLEHLGRYLLKQLDDKRGIPSDNMESASPFQQYQNSLKNKSGIWCTNFAKIYTFFANVAGIPTRLVKVNGSIDGVNLSNHLFSESFIQEKQQWAFVDLTSRKLFVSNKHGDFLNAIDLFYINRAKAFEGLNAMVFKNNDISLVPYSTVSSSEQYYFNKDATFVYRKRSMMDSIIPYKTIQQVLKGVFDPDLAYSLNNSNLKHKIAVSGFLGEFILLLFWLLILAKKVITSKRRSEKSC